MKAGIGVALLLSSLLPAHVGWARAPVITGRADLCNGVCLFALCLSDARPTRIFPCGSGDATMSIIVPAALAPEGRGMRIEIKGASATLQCQHLGAPCTSDCAEDADCAANGPLGRCVDGHCLATSTCAACSN